MTIGSGTNSTPPLKRGNEVTGTEHEKTEWVDADVRRRGRANKISGDKYRIEPKALDIRADMAGKTGTRRENLVEICYGIICMVEIIGWFPRTVTCVVFYPIHHILQLVASKSGIEDGINLELREPVHLDGEGNFVEYSFSRMGIR